MKKTTLLLCTLVLALTYVKPVNAQWQLSYSPPLYGVTYAQCLGVNGSDLFFASTEDLYLSQDYGASWSIVDNGFPLDDYVNSLASSGSITYAGTLDGVFMTSNHGNNWIEIDTGFLLNWMAAMATNGSDLFVSTIEGQIYRTSDTGATWTEVDSGLTDIYNPNTIVIKGTTILMGTNGSGLYRSDNYGKNWVLSNAGLPDSIVFSLAIMGSKIFAGTDNGLYVSVNNGNTWAPSNTGMARPSYAVAIIVDDSDIYIANDGGVFLSRDSGVTWQEMNRGLQYYLGGMRALAVQGPYIFASTREYSISRRALSEVTPCISYITASGPVALCVGDSVILSAPYGSAYLWSDGETTQSILADTAGNYYCNITMSCGNSPSDTTQVTVSPYPVAAFTVYADTSQLHHYIVVNQSISGDQYVFYFWQWGDGSYDTIPYPTHTYADSGFYQICLEVYDSAGCYSTFCDTSFHAQRTTNTMIYMTVVAGAPTDVQELKFQNSDLIIYPNPATNQLTIHTTSFNNEAVMVEVMNVLGQEASPPTPLQRRGEDAVIDVSMLSAGVYFVQLKSESASVTRMFVKE